MPYEWAVDHEGRNIVVRGSGAGTTEDTLALIDEIAGALPDCAGYDLLYDALELQIQSSPADMVRVADALFGGTGARFRRFAMVVPAARAPLGRIFAALADPYGVVANVFDDVDAAREWLAVRGERQGPPEAEPPTPNP